MKCDPMRRLMGLKQGYGYWVLCMVALNQENDGIQIIQSQRKQIEKKRKEKKRRIHG